jgi:hypothetical protein
LLLPDKHTDFEHAIMTVAGRLLARLVAPTTVSELWMRARAEDITGGFDQFCLALAFLYAIGSIEMEQELVMRGKP